MSVSMKVDCEIEIDEFVEGCSPQQHADLLVELDRNFDPDRTLHRIDSSDWEMLEEFAATMLAFRFKIDSEDILAFCRMDPATRVEEKTDV